MRRRRATTKELALTAAYAMVLAAGIVVFGFPLYWMVRGSLIDQAMWMRVPLVWIPPLRDLSLNAFFSIFASEQFRMSRVLFNTATVAVLIMGLNVVFDCMAGFALSKMRLPGKTLILAVLLITMMVPFEGMMVPLYLTVTRIGLADTLLGIILPGAASAFSIVLMWRFFNSVPDEIIEAAVVDGASWGQILFLVAMPAAAPAIATIAVFSFLAGWEAFVWPMLITDPESAFDVLQKVLANATYVSMGGTTETEWAYLMAAALISTLPVLALFLLFQRFFIAGLTGGAVKG
ncbi:MAG: carbohydrate ABC transporter permease [Armatimonadota bacterium]|nr:MAG: carbohydrate ABC transporter permease [Armatimonadota bacterium]